jgi:hypothetical protein
LKVRAEKNNLCFRFSGLSRQKQKHGRNQDEERMGAYDALGLHERHNGDAAGAALGIIRDRPDESPLSCFMQLP